MKTRKQVLTEKFREAKDKLHQVEVELKPLNAQVAKVRKNQKRLKIRVSRLAKKLKAL